MPSPPPANSAAGVRRHQSLNYPNAAGVRSRMNNSGLKRAGTLQAPPLKGHQGAYSGAQSPSPTGADEEYDEYDNDSVRADEDGGYFRMPTQQGQGQYPTSPIGRSSPWSTPGAGNDWRIGGNGTAGIGSAAGGVDDVTRALNSIEISQQYGANAGSYQQGQYAVPPRFYPPHETPVQTAAGLRNNNGGIASAQSRKLQVVTDFDPSLGQASIQSASAYVPPIGHGLQPGQRQVERDEQQTYPHRERSLTASGGGPWDPKERISLLCIALYDSLHVFFQAQQGKNGGANVPNVPPIPSQFLNQGQAPRLGAAQAGGSGMHSQGGRGGSQGSSQSPPADNFITSPIDVPTLIATKGYNPVDFDTRPLFVRVFSLLLPPQRKSEETVTPWAPVLTPVSILLFP